MGAGIPALAEGKPVLLKHVVEDILIPVPQAVRMGLGKGGATLQYVNLTPALKINQHQSGVEIAATRIPMIIAANPVLGNSGERLPIK